MNVAALLLAYGAGLTLFAPRVLARADWTARAPRLGIWAWQAVTSSAVLSVVLAGLVVTVPTMQVSGNLAELLHTCVLMLRAQYATPGGAAVAAGGPLLALAAAGRALWCLSAALWQARRQRGEHARVLRLVGSRRPDLGVTVLEDDRPAAYCLPGFGHRIVLTSAALTALEPGALRAVIAHEKAHIRGRHHLVLAYAAALERAFPRMAFFYTAASETRRLVEMAADDTAADRGAERLTLAGALLELGSGAPAASLAAGGDAAQRVRRLLDVRRPMSRAAAWGWATLAAATVAFPLILAAQPATDAVDMRACPLMDAPTAKAAASPR